MVAVSNAMGRKIPPQQLRRTVPTNVAEAACCHSGGRRSACVLNKSAIVMTCAVWEAYCEDLAAEALEHLVSRVDATDDLPKELRTQVAAELRDDEHQLSVWRLAGDGWRQYVRERLERLTDQRNRALNSPKAGNIDRLFLQAVGIKEVSAAWEWHNTTSGWWRRRHGESGGAQPDWLPTSERFLDPSTDRLMRVWLDPVTRTRHYVPEPRG
jgi:RiboL-PSP-HEPN